MSYNPNEMQPHEERVVIEKRELDEKLAKLKAFCFGENKIFESLDRIDRDLLENQYIYMQHYSKILGRRIARFPVTAPPSTRVPPTDDRDPGHSA